MAIGEVVSFEERIVIFNVYLKFLSIYIYYDELIKYLLLNPTEKNRDIYENAFIKQNGYNAVINYKVSIINPLTKMIKNKMTNIASIKELYEININVFETLLQTFTRKKRVYIDGILIKTDEYNINPFKPEDFIVYAPDVEMT